MLKERKKKDWEKKKEKKADKWNQRRKNEKRK